MGTMTSWGWTTIERIAHELGYAIADQLDHEEHPEPPPITCCEEWTWQPHVGCNAGHWFNRRTRCSFDPVDIRFGLHLCNRCHRALLANGNMTGPLVSVDSLYNSLLDMDQPLGAFVVCEELIKRTWDSDSK